MPANIDTLTEVNLQDAVNAFGWGDQPARAAFVRRLFMGPARRFAKWMLDFDNDVGRVGIDQAGRRALRAHYVRDLRVFGREHIPPTGPVLVLSNHPGATDTLCLFASIGRPDLNIIAVKNPFLDSLVHTTQHLYHVGDDAAQSMRTVRLASAHLRQGHAALTFPAGRIEPDPEVHEGALQSLDAWSESAGIFMRFAPQTIIVPALVSGVIWQKTARHWLTRMRPTRDEKEKLAAALQMSAMVTFRARPTVAKVRFARSITLAEVGSPETDRIHRVVIERMRELIQHPAEGEGESVL
jgi:1-acyl-sn-glycerol-3-phosphate acyltransferase